jgi:hypothetical protein
MRFASIVILVVAGLGCSLKASLARAGRAEQSSTRDVTSQDMDVMRRYSEGLGRDVLKQELGLDLDALRLRIDPDTFNVELVDERQPASKSSAPTGKFAQGLRRPFAPGAGQPFKGSFLLSVDQSGDLLRLGKDVRDIPFGVQLKGDLPLMDRLNHLQTRIWVPFSWRDEMKAEASLPLRLGLKLNDALRGAGLRSDFSNHLGVNQVDAGLGTQWDTPAMGAMDLDYDYTQRFGQGLQETVHWLKLRKDF